MTGLSERQQVTVWLTEAIVAGARTVQRWQQGKPVSSDRVAGLGPRPGRRQVPPSKLSERERKGLLAVANSAEFGHLPPSQIVPRLADRGESLASESTFYRVLRAENQLTLRRVALGQPLAPRATGNPSRWLT